MMYYDAFLLSITNDTIVINTTTPCRPCIGVEHVRALTETSD